MEVKTTQMTRMFVPLENWLRNGANAKHLERAVFPSNLLGCS